MAVSSSSCMKGITIVHVGKRNFRISTASLPTEFSSHKEIHVRQNTTVKDNEEITIKLDVPRSLYGLIIGKGGRSVQQLRHETKTTIEFPLKENGCSIRGKKDGVEMAKKRIEDIINNIAENEKSAVNNTKDDVKPIKDNNKEENITIELSVPQALYGLIIGKKGYTLNKIMAETKTKITLPSSGDLVTISGKKYGIEMAKKRIEDIIKPHNNTDVDNTKIIKDDVKSIEDNKEENTKIELNVPQALYGFIIGKKGYTLNKIMAETKTKIIVPSGGNSGNLVTISGTKYGVEMAKKRIEDIIKSSIFTLRPTHFISLPLTDTHLQHKVKTFKSDVLKLNLPNVDESIFANPSSLHITTGVLHLFRKEDIEGAVKLLESLSAEINDLLGGRPLISILSGTAVMEDDPVKASILYAKIEEPEGQNIIKKLAEYLIKKFEEAGYLKKENRPLKLHATLINTRYRKRSNRNYRDYFNAVQVLNKFSAEFGSNKIESIHISKMGEYDSSGRHRSEGSIKLP